MSKSKTTGSSPTYIQRLHALNLADGSERFNGPTIIQASAAGTGDGSSTVSFSPLLNNQRAALLIAPTPNGTTAKSVFIAWASHGDNGHYHGWIISYDAANVSSQTGAWADTPNGSQGGIWMSGGGLSSDGLGNIFGAAGNGSFDANNSGGDYGDSMFKLVAGQSGLTLSDWFTPINQAELNGSDSDFGVGGAPLILPAQPDPVAHLMVTADKEGEIFLLNRDSLGKYNGSANTSKLLERLRRQRFLAVVGTSGSGKSSLVRAGLIPALRKGFLFEAGLTWKTIVYRPGSAPFSNLANAFRQHYENIEDLSPAFFEQVLRSSSQGIVECARGILNPQNGRENLLLVIDQFEEIFPAAEQESELSRDERAGFVLLLLESARQQEIPIYVLLTMRSDFLGSCQEFAGLPETLNDSQFLVPQLSRDELEMAITAPPGACVNNARKVFRNTADRLLVRGLENVHKKLLIQAAACNLALLMRSLYGTGKPKATHDQIRQTVFAILAFIRDLQVFYPPQSVYSTSRVAWRTTSTNRVSCCCVPDNRVV